MPRPPSLLLQYIRPFGVFEGRWRMSLTWALIKEFMSRIVVIGVVGREVM
jgi:hypothetical protein